MSADELAASVMSLRNAIRYQRELVAEGWYPFGLPRIDLDLVEKRLSAYLAAADLEPKATEVRCEADW